MQARAHHKRVRLAHEIGLPARRQFDRRDERPAGRRNAELRRSREVGIRGDQPRTVQHQPDGLGDDLVIIACRLADDHVIRVDVVHRDAYVVQRVQKPRRADHERGAARRLLFEKCGGGQRAGIEMLLADVQTHALQLLPQLLGRPLRRVGQEQKPLVVFVQPVDELRHTRQQLVAEVDDAVHIADKALACA